MGMGELGVQGFGGGVHYDGDCCLSDDCQEVGPCYVRYKFNQKVELMDKALLSIIITLFVAFMLVVGAHTFTTDAERLVLTPIQEMMALVQRVSDDPSRPIESKGDGGQYETRKIENAIKKITDLLRIGFGVAGSDIVRENNSSYIGSCKDAVTHVCYYVFYGRGGTIDKVVVDVTVTNVSIASFGTPTY